MAFVNVVHGYSTRGTTSAGISQYVNSIHTEVNFEQPSFEKKMRMCMMLETLFAYGSVHYDV